MYKYGGAMEKTDQDESYVQSPPTSEAAASSGFDLTSHKMKMSLDLMSQRKDLPDDLACFLQQQKQRQARLETTMRSFPSRGDMDIEKMEAKKKKNLHEVSRSVSSVSIVIQHVMRGH